MPGAMPETMPDPVITVDAAVLLLLHVPPVMPLVSVVVRPTQTLAVPDIAAGKGFTVTIVVVAQLVASV